MSATAIKKKISIEFPRREVVRSASIRVSEASHLCRVQAVTREMCRALGLSEGEVFAAVIAVTEAAHSFFIEGARTGEVDLSITRERKGLRLEVRTKPAGAGAYACVSFALGAP